MIRLRFAIAIAILTLAGCDDATPPDFDFAFDGGLALVEGGPTAPDGGVDVVPGITLTPNLPTSIDFGELECGAPAPDARIFEVTNTGTAPLTWKASLSATNAFSLVGETSGTIAPGAKGQLTTAISGVAASEVARTVVEATLTLDTNVPGFETVTATLRRTAAGGTLEVSAPSAFGDVPVTTTSAPAPITVTNTGNRPLSLKIEPPSDAHFQVTAPVGEVAVAAGASVPNLSARFAPTAATMLEGTAALTVTGAICGASATELAFSGKGVIGVARTSPGALAFGRINCGATAAAKTVTLANDGGAAFTFSAALLEGAASPFAVAPASGSVAPGHVVTVTVTPKAVPQTASTEVNAFGDVLRIRTNAVGDQDHDIPLTQTAQGAVISSTPSAVGFEGTPITTTRTSPVSIRNSGNASITLAPAATGADYSVASTSAFALAAGGTSIVTARFSPTTVGAKSGAVALKASGGVLCAPLPPATTLSGTGTNGTLGLSTTTLEFGSTNCGATASPQTFEVRNTGNGAFDFVVAAGKGAASPYNVTPVRGTVPAAGKVIVTVTPKPIPTVSDVTANLYGDTLTVTPTGIVGGTSQSLALRQTARGARLSFTAASVPFSNVVTGTTSRGALGVRNDGNAPITVAASDSGSDAASFALAAGPHAIAAGGQAALAPTFSPLRTGAHGASIGIAVGANEALCAPLPAAVAETGVGIAGALSVDATSVSFPAVACGSAAQTKTITLRNGGGSPLTWNAAVSGGFALSAQTGTLAASASTTVTITSPTFTTTRGNVTPVAGSVTISDNVYGSTAKTVTLSATPSGAILTQSVGSYAFGNVVTGTTSNASPQPAVSNAGNVNAPLLLTWTGKATHFAVGAGLTSAAGGSVPVGLTFNPLSRGLSRSQLNVAVAAGTPLCAALPPGIAVSGTGVGGVLSVPTELAVSAQCGGSSGTDIVLSNTGDAPLTFVGTYPGGVVKPASATIPALGSLMVAVVPPAVSQTATPGSITTSNVSFSTNVYGDVAHDVTVSTTAVGGNLDFGLNFRGIFLVSSALDLGEINNCWVTGSRLIRNNGNGGAVYGYPIGWRLIDGPAPEPGYTYRPELIIEQPAPTDLVLPNVASAYITVKAASDAVPPSTTCNATGNRHAMWGTYTFEVYLPENTTPGICHAPKTLTVTATVPAPIF